MFSGKVAVNKQIALHLFVSVFINAEIHSVYTLPELAVAPSSVRFYWILHI